MYALRQLKGGTNLALEENAGTALDLVGAFMNHSCDPNAFVFFENSQLRWADARAAAASEEDVWCRRGVLQRAGEVVCHSDGCTVWAAAGAEGFHEAI